MVTECFLVRHGEIEANVEGKWHGTTDSELTQLGRRQTKRLGDRFREEYADISVIYASPLKRTMNTAQAIADGLEQMVTPIAGLIEYGVGEWEGLSYEVMSEEHQFFAKMAADHHFSAPGGESLFQVHERIRSTFFQLIEAHRGEKIALVGHGAAFAVLMADLLEGQRFPFYHHQMGNTGISHLTVTDENEVTRLSFSDGEHLTGLL